MIIYSFCLKTGLCSLHSLKRIFVFLLFLFQQTQSNATTLGQYLPVTVLTGTNTVVKPDSVPTAATSLIATASGGFSGTLTADPVTGNVMITNASPAGVHTITVAAGNITTSFQLTVNNIQCGTGNLVSSNSITGSTSTYHFVVADFNNDGIQDLVMANQGGLSVTIQLGLIYGGFNPITVPVSGGPVSVTAGDFNGDGNQDFATANYNEKSVSIRLGNGHGAFTNGTDFLLIGNIAFVVSADFNNDGKMDLAIADAADDVVSIRLGNGLGAFTGTTDIPVGDNPRTLEIGDFNNDGIEDIACANFVGQSVSIRLGDGTGNFTGTTNISFSPTTVWAVKKGDFNNDGNIDLATSLFGSSIIDIRFGDGTGSFVMGNTVSVGIGPETIAISDFNNDGFLDFASGNNTSVSVRFGVGNGTFTGSTTITTAGNVNSIASGDFNNDNEPDLVVTTETSITTTFLNVDNNEISIKGNSLNIPDGTRSFSSVLNTDIALLNNASSKTITFTIANSGTTQLAVNNIFVAGNSISEFAISGITLPISLNPNSSTTFNLTYTPQNQGSDTAIIHVSNLDCNETDYDFAVLGRRVVFINNGYPASTVMTGGSIVVSPIVQLQTPTPLFASTNTTFKGTFSADPVTGDVRVINARPAGLYLVTVSDGLGINADKSFTLVVDTPICSSGNFSASTSTTVQGQPYSVAVGDFNKDGNEDFLTANYQNSSVSVRLGNGIGSFTGTTNVTVGGGPISVAVGDFNKDGNQDFVSSNYTANTGSIRFGNGSGGFTGSTNISTGSSPAFVAVGDFNNDSKQDLAFAIAANLVVAIRLGDGNGGFTSAPNVAVGSVPRSLVIGDFNEDGNQDLAVANLTGNSISIRLGNGAGGFSGSTNLACGANTYGVTIGDFNNDNHQDLAATIYGGSSVIIFNGDGTGSFINTSTVNVLSAPISASVGDFNSDGNQDLAIGNSTGNVSIRFGNGSGAFFGTTNLAAGQPYSLAVADFNNDGREDIISTSYNSSAALVYLGIDNGEINLLANLNNIPDGSTLISSTINTDFGTVSPSGSSTRTFTINNTGLGTLIVNSITVDGLNQSEFIVNGINLPTTISANGSTTFNVSFQPSSLGLKNAMLHVFSADCDETDFDFAIQGMSSPGTISPYPTVNMIAGSNKTIFPLQQSVITTLFVSTSVKFTGLLTINSTTGVIQVTNAGPSGIYIVKVTNGTIIQTFTLNVQNPQCSKAAFVNSGNYSVGSHPNSVSIGDFNNDGKQDLVTADNGFSLITVKTGNGDGTFSPFTTLNSHRPFSVNVGEFNNDNLQDIIITDNIWYSTSIHFGTGSGFSIANVVAGGNKPTSTAIGDFNNDGNKDIAISNSGINSVSILLGNGTGAFTTMADVAVGTAPYKVVIGDFNNDGNQDIATANNNSNNTSIRLGNGAGGFTGTTNIGVGADPISIVVVDLNNDGIQDLVTANNGGSTVSYLKGNGVGGFTNLLNQPVGSLPFSITKGDFNGDGYPDLLTTNTLNSSEAGTILIGNGTNSFAIIDTVPAGSSSTSAAVGDFNGDSLLDFVITNYADNNFTVFKGTKNSVDVSSNGIVISNGNITPAVANNTDFGSIVTGVTFTDTFAIKNNAAASFLIDSIYFTGPAAGNFSVAGITLPFNLTNGVTKLFRISCSTASTGVKTATLHIRYPDCLNTEYTFAVKATGICVSPTFDLCPGNLVINPSDGTCRATANYNVLVSGTPTPTLSYSFSGATVRTGTGTGSGETFSLGTTLVVITAMNSCSSTTCTFTVTVNATIDDNNACTIDACNSITGAITHTPVSTTDLNACTIDGCDPLTGVYHNPVNTNDNNLCTSDGCDSVSGVFHNPVNTNDANSCTIDGCDPLTGVYHNPVNSDDNNLCTIDGCDPLTGIFHQPINTDDNNACTTDGCDPLSGVYHNPININDNNVCTNDLCDTITGGYHTPVDIDDNNICTIDACDPVNGISHTLIDINDNNVCTIGGCDPVTGPSQTQIDYDDHDICTTDGCDSITGVYHIPVNTDDNDVCTIDGCDPITGINHTLVNYDDGNVCTTDGCDPLTGVYHNLISSNDNNACTEDGCDPVSGVYHNQINTDDNNACTIDGCDPMTGVYNNQINTDDNDACTTDGCDVITGVYHTQVNTNDDNACTTDGCDPATGVFHNYLNVDDNNVCTLDGCDSISGVYHNPVSVDDNNICTNDGCDIITGIYHTPVDADDNNICTIDGCDLTGIYHLPVNTDDGNECTIDGCDPLRGISHDDIDPDDGNACTIDVCDPLDGTISHTDNSPFIQIAITSEILCYGGSGCININAVGGVPPYSGIGTYCNLMAGEWPFTISDSVGCEVSVTASLPEPPKLQISSSSTPTYCNGNTGSATANATGGTGTYSYLWTPGNATTQTISNLPLGNYTVTVTDANGCSTNSTVAVANSGTPPAPPLTINGTSGVCKGQMNVVYCVDSVPNATSYQWTLPNGISGTSTSNCITVNVSTTFNGGFIYVSAVNSCGASTPTSMNLVLLTSKPGVPAIIVGPSQLCPVSTVSFSITPVPNATSYLWTVQGGLSIISGQGTTAINVNVPAGFSSGKIIVNAVNCKGKSGERKKSVKGGVPAQPDPISGSSNPCRTSTKNYSINNVPTATSYTWNVNGGATIVSGQGTTNISISWSGSTISPVTLSVTANNICGSSVVKTKSINVQLNCRIQSANDIEQEPPFTANEITLFPNPTSDNFTLEYNSAAELKCIVTIYDVLGQKVYFNVYSSVEGLNQRNIDVSELMPGVYMVSVEDGLLVRTVRLVVE